MAKDAAEIAPKFVPAEGLYGRDNSGGIDKPALNRHGEFGDGGKIQGAKSYLSATGGSDKGDKY